LLLGENLEDFIRESPAFLHAATKLFDSRYPQLGLKARLDGMITLLCAGCILMVLKI
jgi:hypothetical protein